MAASSCLTRRFLDLRAAVGDIGGDMEGLDRGELGDAAALAPVEEAGRLARPHQGAQVGAAGVGVADVPAKNSRKRFWARSPARAIAAGRCARPARASSRRGGIGTSCRRPWIIRSMRSGASQAGGRAASRTQQPVGRARDGARSAGRFDRPHGSRAGDFSVWDLGSL